MAQPVIQSKEAINAFNLQLRSQPWYQQWFASKGLNPNQVQLSQAQRQELEQVITAHGAPAGLFQDMEIDPAGNLNTEHGFASQPTWLKALEIGGAAAAGGYGGASAFGLGGGTAGSSAGTMTASSAAAAPAATSAGILSAGSRSVTTAGQSIWARLAPTLVGAGLQGVGSVMQARAANKASQQQVDASNRALDFSKNIYEDQKANQAPYLGIGQGAITSLGQMLRIPQNSPQAMTTPAAGPLTALSQGQNPSTVMMRAPDGSQRAVPAAQVAMLQARGATVVQ